MPRSESGMRAVLPWPVLLFGRTAADAPDCLMGPSGAARKTASRRYAAAIGSWPVLLLLGALGQPALAADPVQITVMAVPVVNSAGPVVNSAAPVAISVAPER